MSALLQVRRLRKCFGPRPLLDVEGLELYANTLTALTGDNGSGKSTLLRILAGLEPAQELDLEYAQHRIDGAHYPDEWRREIVYVHQHPYLFNTSIAANIEYGLKLRRVGSAARRAASAEAMRWAGLDAVAAVPPQRLSGGEKQKVALARAKVLAPRVLLVDEPTANLDRAARTQIVALLRDSASTNNCVLVACHDREIIDLPGVKRLHLEGGKIVAG